MRYYTPQMLNSLKMRYQRTIDHLAQRKFDGFPPGVRRDSVQARDEAIKDFQELINDLDLTIASLKEKGSLPSS